MSTYLLWNDALARHFFRPEMAGRDVRLYVNEELIEELGRPLGGGVSEFVEAVKAGPPWARHQGLCQRALSVLENWRSRGSEFPPYIAYLALFVLAAGLEGAFAQHAYYPRLHQLLGDDDRNQPASFARMLELWDDLERWSTQDRGGDLGLYSARIAGQQIHVGLPLAQTILSANEIRHLPLIFAQAGFDPTSPPSDDELARALRTQGTGIMRRRTLQLAATRGDAEAYDALLDAIGEELASWDGTVAPDAQPPGATEDRRAYGAVRLCLAYDRISGRAAITLRCRLNKELPERGLTLRIEALPETFYCEETLPGWSTRVVIKGTSSPLQAGRLDWAAGGAFRDENHATQFRLHPSDVRVLVRGETEGLPDFVEVFQLPANQPFLLLYRDSRWPELAEWASTECDSFEALPVREGLPAGWRLAASKGARSDARVRGRFACLGLPGRLRLRLAGGVRSAPGASYFSFAPPSVLVEGGDGTETVACNTTALVREEDASVWFLPDGLLNDTRLVISARKASEHRRLALFLTGAFEWRVRATPEELDRFGQLCDPMASSVHLAGAAVTVDAPDELAFTRQFVLPPELEATAGGRVFLLGREPDHVVCLPAERFPGEWAPVWAVPIDRHGIAIYCGSSLEDEAPQVAGCAGTTERRDIWKDVLWHRRKRIAPPENPALRGLWKAYVEAARRA
jgi:hypothetical protein